jgi:hypothetical protein
VLLVVAAFGVLTFFRLGGGSGSGDDALTAAIVDQLSLTAPNPAFAEEATSTLEQAGYEVDYYPGEDVSVAFYRALPSYDYDVIVLRAHSDRLEATWQGRIIDETVLFTSEPFDEKKYESDRAKKRLTSARYYEGSEQLFGISPDFVEDRMDGDFDGALVIAMGCEGLATERTAEAFINKGASGYIGWDKLVSAPHTDEATQLLLKNLLIEKQPVATAVTLTMDEVGPDPAYDSTLLAYP